MSIIVTKRRLNPVVTLMELDCPHIARKAKPGQFVMVRPDELGERIPLTIADYDAVRGTVTIMYQRLGLTTHKLDQMEAGENILDVVGPLGNPTETDGVKRACVDGPVFRGERVRFDDVGTVPFDALGAPGWKARSVEDQAREAG